MRRWRPISMRERPNGGPGILRQRPPPLMNSVAALVEAVAHAALSRSDVAAAVAGFEQAARLSPRKSDRGRRLFNAGAAASQLGQGDELLREALAHTDDHARRGEIVVLRARGAIERGDPGLVAQLVRDEGRRC